MEKLIEVTLPLSEINERTIHEKKGAVGHPANLHLWWGRSPIDSVQAALTAMMIDAPESTDELHERLNRILNGGYTELGSKPTLFDPFTGFGGIAIAAQRLGLPVFAGDLNPIAVLLTKAASEIPAKFAGRSPINQLSLKKSYAGSNGLAEDIAYYGEWLRQKAYERLKDFYPHEPDGIPAAWIWARTVKCPNPACGCTMPLVSSYIISSKDKEDVWAEPVLQENKVRFEVKTGKCPDDRKSNKIGSNGAVFRCPVCGCLTTDSYVKQMGMDHQIGAQMMAIVLETKNGKQYISPTEAQERAAETAIPADIPPGEIPDNLHWFSPPGFGMKSFTDLFSVRQLTALVTFSDLLVEVQNKVASDALAAGMAPTGGSLAEGGTGALAYGQAITVYLAFVIDKIADAGSTICSWRTSGGGFRNTFGRQSIPMVWTFAEGNPFSSITGNFAASLKQVVAAVKGLTNSSPVEVFQWDACEVDCPKNAVICTEIPYYKAIDYARLSDFFYIWMRKSLKSVYPELFSQMVTSKNELSTTAQYYEADASECDRIYEEKMQAMFSRWSRNASRDYPHILFFEYHKADEEVLYAEPGAVGNRAPLETLISGLLQAGFSVNAIWPMRTAPVSEKADGVRVAIVVRRIDKDSQITRRGFVSALKRELPTVLDRMYSGGIDSFDQMIIGLGGGLSLFSQHKRIINANGTDMSVRDALQIIGQEVKEYIIKNTADSETSDAVPEED